MAYDPGTLPKVNSGEEQQDLEPLFQPRVRQEPELDIQAILRNPANFDHPPGIIRRKYSLFYFDFYLIGNNLYI